MESVRVPKHFVGTNVKFGLTYAAKADDKFVVTYPKAGTTWAQQIVALIVSDGRIDNLAFSRLSFLEFSGADTLKEPVIKTHLPFAALPKNPSAKYLLVFRNPKDSCVSFFYHTLKTDPQFEGDFHDFFRLWIKGEVPYGDYFEHTLDYWNHRMDRNFEFLIYEQMKSNTKEAVLKIAHFLGEDFEKKLLKDSSLMNKIIDNSTIDTLKAGLELNNLNILNFVVRKGEVGDWKNHMTKEESELVDAKFTEILGKTKLANLWKECMKR